MIGFHVRNFISGLYANWRDARGVINDAFYPVDLEYLAVLREHERHMAQLDRLREHRRLRYWWHSR